MTPKVRIATIPAMDLLNHKLPEPDDFRFKCLVEVRFRDLDPMGHVNNAVYFSYFETARAAYMKSLGHTDPVKAEMTELFPFILAQTTCNFLAPSTLGQVLVVYIRASDVGKKSFEFEYLIAQHEDKKKVALGSSTQVYYDYRAEKTVRIPQEFLERLEHIENRKLSRH